MTYLSDAHIGIANNVGLRTSKKALLLNVNFNMNIYAIQQRTGASFLIFRNDSGSTSTGHLWVIEQPHGQGFIAAIN